MKLANGTYNTVTVTRALAKALDRPCSEEKRAGTWGYTIGNIFAETRKELHEKALMLLEVGAGRNDWKEILLSAETCNATPMFTE